MPHNKLLRAKKGNGGSAIAGIIYFIAALVAAWFIFAKVIPSLK